MRTGRILRFFLALALLVPAVAQESPAPVVAGAEAPTRSEAIASITEQIETINREIEVKRQSIADSAIDEERREQFAESRALERRLESAKLRLLEIVATDVDLSEFESVEDRPFSLQSAMEDLIRPLVEEVKRATAGSREAQALRNEFDVATERATVIRQALLALDRTLAEESNPTAARVLQTVRDEFGRRYDSVSNDVAVLGYQLDEIEKDRKSLVGETQGLLASFFEKRGKNLLLALMVAVTVFLGLRFLHRYLHERTTFFRKGRTFPTRVFDVALAVFTVLGALLGAVIVLLAAGDWVLLGLIVLLLIVVVLTAKDALPGYMDEMRLLLNIGPVREDERIVYNGVPWLVENLTFHTTLRNPALRGGMLRMPIARIAEMISRPVSEREPYFPCEEGDWVLLDDGVYGRVVFQSVEMVRLVLLGGAQKTYPTGEFLEQNPQNHSHGFRIKTTIGIDYENQARSTTEILDGLREFFEREVHAAVDHKLVRSLKVEFALANTSSLDYEVMLDVDGELAPRLYPLTRTLQRIGVDACNHFGLVIPFQQVTIHRGVE